MTVPSARPVRPARPAWWPAPPVPRPFELALIRQLGWSWRELCRTPAPAVAQLARLLAEEARARARDGDDVDIEL